MFSIAKLSEQNQGFIQCPGFKKKIPNLDEYEVIDSNIIKKIINAEQTGINYDVERCTCMFEINYKYGLKITCQVCNFSFCPKCLMECHNLSCEEYEKQKKEKDDLNLLKQYMDSQNMVFCPKCNIIVFRTMNCKHITCKCKHEFCYICLGDYRNCACPTYSSKCPKCKAVGQRGNNNTVTCTCKFIYCYSCLQGYAQGHKCKEL